MPLDERLHHLATRSGPDDDVDVETALAATRERVRSRRRRRIWVWSAAAAVLVVIVGLFVLVDHDSTGDLVTAGRDHADTGSTVPSDTAADGVDGPPAAASEPLWLWLSAERLPAKPSDLAVVLVNSGAQPSPTFGVGAGLVRWDGDEWRPR